MTMWIQTYTGKAVDFDKPITPDVICLEDIAHALAMQCRFNGHCLQFYSVAEHSVHVANRIDEQYCNMPTKQVRQWALLHDAAEAYVGNMVRPLKHSGRLDAFKSIELAVRSAIEYALVGVRPSDEIEKNIKHADLELLATERDKIMAPPPQPWDPLPDPLDISLWCLLPEPAYFTFMQAAKERGLL